MDEKLFKEFPSLTPIRQRLANQGLAKLPKGTQIFAEGDPCQMIAFLVQGRVRVFKLAESGREMTLYRIHPGESCILSISSLLSHNPLPAIAQVEEDVEAFAMPAALFSTLMKEEPCLQAFVFDLLSRRLSEVLTTVEEVAFHRVDQRIMRHLLELPQQEGLIQVTHQAIAVDLGTSREVVSRILKELESQGLLQLQRGAIQLTDINELVARADL